MQTTTSERGARVDRLPCVIGVAQRTVHKEEGPAPEPLDLWEHVARAAVADTGARGDVLGAVESLGVVFCESWRYDAPAQRLAARLRTDPRLCYDTGTGGHVPYTTVQAAARSIAVGDLDVAMVCGAEALATVHAYNLAGESPNWSFPAFEPTYPHTPDVTLAAVGMGIAGSGPFTFSLLDNARRARLGVDSATYLGELGSFMAGMTTVASRNPYAWFRRVHDAEALVTPRHDNRQVTVPYTKLMTAMWNVDMAAGVIIASEEAADRLGVPRDRRVYLHGWCSADDPYEIGARPSISTSPAMAASSEEAMRIAGVRLSDVEHLDVYSCFPASVNLARDALGLEDRSGEDLTVTGGLPYFGGPGSDYGMHAIATVTEVLRNAPGSFGMTMGTGKTLNRQACAIYSTMSPGALPALPAESEIQRRLDALPSYSTTAWYTGPATVATFSVLFDRDGDPRVGVAICDTADGVRGHGRIDDPDLLRFAVDDDLVGCSVDLVAGDDCAVVRGLR